MSQTIDAVYRDFNTAGVPASGDYQPRKPEIRALLKQIQNAGGQAVTRNTLSALQGVTPPNENYMGVVLTGAGAGYYSRVAGAWVFGRPFADTFAKVVLAGSGTAQTGAVSAGVTPASVEVFIAKVGTTNTGPLTLEIGGGAARQVVNLSGAALSPGEWSGTTLFYLNDANQYQLLLDAGAAASAAASAASAAQSAADAQAGSGRPFDTKAMAEAYSPVTAPSFIQLAGLSAPSDGLGGFFTKVGADPGGSPVDKIQIASGQWYQRAPDAALAVGAAVPLPNYLRLDVLTPEDFGYKATQTIGQKTSSMQAWAGAAGRKKLRSGQTYQTNATITHGPTTTIIDMEGATIDASADDSGFSVGQAVMRVRNTPVDATMELPSLNGTQNKGAHSLLFNAPSGGQISPSSLSAGDTLLIYNSNIGSFSTWRDEWRAGEFVTVEQVLGSSVRVTSPLRDAYSPAGVTVRRVPRFSPRLIGGKIITHSGIKYPQGLLLEEWTGGSIEGMEIQNARRDALAVFRARGIAIRDCVVEQFIRGNADGISDHYGLGIYNSQGVLVQGGRYVGGNHGIVTGGGSVWGSVPVRDLKVIGAEIKGFWLSGFNSHGNTEDLDVIGCTIDGGVSMGGDRSRMSNCIVRCNPVDTTAGATAIGGFFGFYIAEALGTDFSIDNCRFERLGPELIAGLTVIDFGAYYSFITAKTTRGGTIRLRGLTIDAPNMGRIIGIRNNGSSSTQRRVDISDVHVTNPKSGRAYDYYVGNDSGAAWANVSVQRFFSPPTAIGIIP